MFLREFIYFDKDMKGEDDFDADLVDDKRYNPELIQAQYATPVQAPAQ